MLYLLFFNGLIYDWVYLMQVIVKRHIYLLFLPYVLFAKSLYSQQMVVDDAAVTTYGAFQVESWYGTKESWVLPAVSLMPGYEISFGSIFDTGNSFKHDTWLIENKYIYLEANRNALGLVKGVTTNTGWSIQSIYAYIPYSRLIMENESILHLNLGFSLEKENEWGYEILYGIRTDLKIFDKYYLLAEMFSADTNKPGYQAGLRIVLLDELLELDITGGSDYDDNYDNPFFNFGIAYTPSKIW